MASGSRGQATPPSYMDGISVKISEKYKPPRRINASMSYSQTVTLSKLMAEPPSAYDFLLENSAMCRVHEWQRARAAASEERSRRLADASGHPDYYSDDRVLVPVTVLAPAPAATAAHKSINLSDFESDTSSPFDNLELKTINDLEELAQVLNRGADKAEPAASTANGYYSRGCQRPAEVAVAVADDELRGLRQEERCLAAAISKMGFPLARVARALQAIGSNQKKVVEHLLALSDLLVLGFPEQSVADALLRCDNDRDKALDLLIA